jgi:hypothetical protein
MIRGRSVPTMTFPAHHAISDAAIRARARRAGYAVQRSRQQFLHLNNRGQYRLLNARTNFVVLGERFDATLADIDAFLDDGT